MIRQFTAMDLPLQDVPRQVAASASLSTAVYLQPSYLEVGDHRCQMCDKSAQPCTVRIAIPCDDFLAQLQIAAIHTSVWLCLRCHAGLFQLYRTDIDRMLTFDLSCKPAFAQWLYNVLVGGHTGAIANLGATVDLQHSYLEVDNHQCQMCDDVINDVQPCTLPIKFECSKFWVDLGLAAAIHVQVGLCHRCHATWFQLYRINLNKKLMPDLPHMPSFAQWWHDKVTMGFQQFEVWPTQCFQKHHAQTRRRADPKAKGKSKSKATPKPKAAQTSQVRC